MKPFPTANTLEFLLGNEVSSIVIGPYCTDIMFAEGSWIRVEQGLEYVDEQGRLHSHDPQLQPKTESITFQVLIGERVVDLETTDWRMTLTFASGRKLVILSEKGPHESGQIFHCMYDDRGHGPKSINMFVF